MPDTQEEQTEAKAPLYTISAGKLNFMRSFIFAFLFAGICFYVLGPLLLVFSLAGEDALSVVRWAGGTFCFVTFLMILSPFLSYGVFQKMYIYDDRIVYNRGFFTRESATLSLSRITGVEVSESLWQRMIGTGNIIIWVGSFPRVMFVGALRPREKAEHIQEAANLI